MKCDIFKGLLLCGCMMSALDSEGMQVVLQPCRRPVANQEAVVAKEMLETRQQRMALMNGFLPKTRPQHKGGPVKEENIENAVLPQSPASISTSSEEQAQYPTSMTFTAENIKDFYNLTTEVAQKLESVTFEGVNIGGKFEYQFNHLFYHGSYDKLNRLIFDHCHLRRSMQYNDLFSGSYAINNLVIIDDELCDEDAVATYCQLYPWLLSSVTFKGSKLNETEIIGSLAGWELPPEGILSVES